MTNHLLFLDQIIIFPWNSLILFYMYFDAKICTQWNRDFLWLYVTVLWVASVLFFARTQPQIYHSCHAAIFWEVND